LTLKYATAAWTLPSGEQGNNALFFSVNGGLVGAFFPVNGIPEMPKPTGLPPLPPEFMAKLHAMTPEQREQVIQRIRRQREGGMMSQGTAIGTSGATGNAGNGGSPFSINSSPMQIQQPIQQQSDIGGTGGAPPTFSGAAIHPPQNFAGGLNIMNTMGIGYGQPQSMMGLSATLPRPLSVGAGGGAGSMRGAAGVSSGVNLGNVNQEIFQNFIQRGGNMGMGMSGQGQEQ
jgi:hypothetical protein